MANTTKKTTTKDTKKDKVVIDKKDNQKDKVVDKEKEELKSKLADLEKKLADLLAQQSSQPVQTIVQQKPKRNIKLISLTRGALYLRGSRIHKFDKQFDSRVFTEGEVRLIYSNMPKTLAEGYVYIADNDMVEELELTDAYSILLDDNALKNLLKKNPNDVVEIYKNANKVQQDIIIGMIEDQKLAGKNLDANILIELGKLCGKNLMNIEPLTE